MRQAAFQSQNGTIKIHYRTHPRLNLKSFNLKMVRLKSCIRVKFRSVTYSFNLKMVRLKSIKLIWYLQTHHSFNLKMVRLKL